MAFLVLFSYGCATKKFVNQEVAGLDKKIEDVSVEVEANQKRIREHDERLATIGEIVNKQDSQFKDVDTKIEEVKGLVRGNLIAKETSALERHQVRIRQLSADPRSQGRPRRLRPEAHRGEQGRLSRDPGSHGQHGAGRVQHGLGPEAGRTPSGIICTANTISPFTGWRSSASGAPSPWPTIPAAKAGPRTGASRSWSTNDEIPLEFRKARRNT